MLDETLCDDLLSLYCPKFCNTLPAYKSPPELISNGILAAFSGILQSLHSRLQDGAFSRDTVTMVQAALLLQIDRDSIKFDSLIEQLFSTAFKVFHACNPNNQNDESITSDDGNSTMDNDSALCKLCENEKLNCCCQALLSNFESICKMLSKLNMTDVIASSAIASVLCKEIRQYINHVCKADYCDYYLSKCLMWTQQNVIAWLHCIFGFADTNNDSTGKDLLWQWEERLEYLVHLTFAETRISELFEIIVEYPDSQPSVKDLKDCMSKTDVRGKLVSTLQKSFNKRLLQPAVNTADIITQYISTIKMLRYLDPEGVLLELVCLPLREYLRQRDDTIKCVIVSLTDQESGAELAEELLASDQANGANSSLSGNADDSDGEDWMPDPVDALPDAGGRHQRTADIINVLINIYGSKDMFVSEYRTLLADRILSSYSYDVSTERRYLELLKRRFGENHLNYCDIMLKDVQASQRINRQIKTHLEKDNKNNVMDDLQFDALILSGTFWPSLKEDSVEPPASVKSAMELYTTEFESAKGMRTLEWMNNLGKVELELELDNNTKTITCTPAQAVVITTFQQKDNWSLSELSEETGVSSTSLRNRLSFWVSQGVIRETAIDQFSVSKSFQPTSREAMYEGNEDDSFTADNQDAKDEELQVYWSYIVGMLTNIGNLSLERIHSMLKMFAMHGQNSKQCSKEEVKEFLQSKIHNGELQFANNVYTLPH